MAAGPVMRSHNIGDEVLLHENLSATDHDDVPVSIIHFTSARAYIPTSQDAWRGHRGDLPFPTRTRH